MYRLNRSVLRGGDRWHRRWLGEAAANDVMAINFSQSNYVKVATEKSHWNPPRFPRENGYCLNSLSSIFYIIDNIQTWKKEIEKEIEKKNGNCGLREMLTAHQKR